MKPIIFSTENVKAILAGTKTQTRRVYKEGKSKNSAMYEVGDKLWVKETFANISKDTDDYLYKALPMFDDCKKADISWKWKSPMFMPREAARIFLKVKSVWIERLQDISQADTQKEGVNYYIFPDYWDKINGKRPGCSWADNPLVRVIEFEKCGGGN